MNNFVKSRMRENCTYGSVRESSIYYRSSLLDQEDTAAIQNTLGEGQYSCIWKEMAFGESKEFLKLAMFLS